MSYNNRRANERAPHSQIPPPPPSPSTSGPPPPPQWPIGFPFAATPSTADHFDLQRNEESLGTSSNAPFGSDLYQVPARQVLRSTVTDSAPFTAQLRSYPPNHNVSGFEPLYQTGPNAVDPRLMIAVNDHQPANSHTTYAYTTTTNLQPHRSSQNSRLSTIIFKLLDPQHKMKRAIYFCPNVLANPMDYHVAACEKPKTRGGLRQHIHEKHRHDYCPHCFERFHDKEERKRHTKDRSYCLRHQKCFSSKQEKKDHVAETKCQKLEDELEIYEKEVRNAAQVLDLTIEDIVIRQVYDFVTKMSVDFLTTHS